MPSRNAAKEDIPDAVFHIYNRGLERRTIFIDSHDYRRFKKQLRKAQEAELTVQIWAYSLMPNHFHLLLHQSDIAGITRFMRRLATAYAKYFNGRYGRTGQLFQGRYKGVRIVGPGHLMMISRYIHLNPEKAGLGWRQHLHSSKKDYLNYADATTSGSSLADLAAQTSFLADPRPVLQYFDMPQDYRRYLSRRRDGH